MEWGNKMNAKRFQHHNYDCFKIYVDGELVSECCMPHSVGSNVDHFDNENVIVITEQEGLEVWYSDEDIYHISIAYVAGIVAGRYREATGKVWPWIDEEWLKKKAYKEKSHG